MSMDKVKVALTVLSIALIVIPIGVELFIYKDNLPGLVLPPMIQNQVSPNNNSGNGTQVEEQSLPDFQPPQPVGEPQYNPNTGAFNYPFNFTNPLSTEISIDQLSATVSGPNNQILGNISIIEPISIEPGANAIIDVTGNLNQDSVNQILALYSNSNLQDLSLNNVNVTVGGVNIHLDHVDAGSISQLEGYLK